MSQTKRMLVLVIVLVVTCLYLGWTLHKHQRILYHGMFIPLLNDIGLSSSLTSDRSPPTTPDGSRYLKGLGYVGGSDISTQNTGVVRHKPSQTKEGVNLYVSGHGSEAFLVNMEGAILHRWHKSWEEAFPNTPPDSIRSGLPSQPTYTAQANHWRKVYLYPNGDLLAIFNGLGLIKLDKDSNLLWAKAMGAHHDVTVGPDNRIYVLTRRPAWVDVNKRSLGDGYQTLDEAITVLSPSGEVLRRLSHYRATFNSNYTSILQWSQLPGEMFHSNTIKYLQDIPEQSYAPFRPQGALVSFNKLNTIGVIDLRTNQLEWILAGMSETQHDPTLLENGNVLLFNNRREYKHYLVIEVDPVTQQVTWSYEGEDSTKPFYSRCCGTVQRLDNGNTLITVSRQSRALEVTPDKTIVWEYVNPYEVEVEGEGNYTGSLFELRRFNRNYVSGWLSEN